MVTIVIVILTIIFFSFGFFISAKIYINYRASPPNVDCKYLVDTYSETQLADLAGLEYMYFESVVGGVKELMAEVSQTGAMPCFCDDMASKGKAPDTLYEV